MARPFVDSITDEEVAQASSDYDVYCKVRKAYSMKALAARHNITPLTMSRRIKRLKEGRDVPRIRSQRT
jgi:DNA-binding transcriptional LysR family regulator